MALSCMLSAHSFQTGLIASVSLVQSPQREGEKRKTVQESAVPKESAQTNLSSLLTCYWPEEDTCQVQGLCQGLGKPLRRKCVEKIMTWSTLTSRGNPCATGIDAWTQAKPAEPRESFPDFRVA